jgi:hypothetical protein
MLWHVEGTKGTITAGAESALQQPGCVALSQRLRVLLAVFLLAG